MSYFCQIKKKNHFKTILKDCLNTELLTFWNRHWWWWLGCRVGGALHRNLSLIFLSQFHSPSGAFLHAFQSLTNESSLIQIFPFVGRIVKSLSGLNPVRDFTFSECQKAYKKNNYQGYKICLYIYHETLSSSEYPLFNVILCILSSSLFLNMLFYFIFWQFLPI